MNLFVNKNAEKKKNLIEDINARMGVCSDQLVVFFATEDSSNKPAWKDPFDWHYSDEGFYINLNLPQNCLPSPWPDELTDWVSEIIDSHFVWISKKICEGDDICFAWLYAHELQHYKQSKLNRNLLRVEPLLTDIGYDRTKTPTEIQCEMVAKKIVVGLFGEDRCYKHLCDMRSTSENNYERYGWLVKLDAVGEFDVEREIQTLICRDREKIKKRHAEKINMGDYDYSVDIDKLCSIVDPHEAILSSVTNIHKNNS